MKISNLSDVAEIRDYLNRVGAEPRSLRTAVVKELNGKYWTDVAVIHFSRDGEINCSSLEHMPTEKEQEKIKDALAKSEWPEIKPLSRITNPHPMIANAEKKDVFEFRDVHNMIQMVQVRVENEDGKNYVPFTYWDDDEWRIMEPDGDLPLFGMEKLKDNTTVFIHEGAKAARKMNEMIEKGEINSHPWGPQLDAAVHVGWIGGALSPQRTDWSELKKQGVKRAYIVADNDSPGMGAIPRIARELRMTTFSIQFTSQWPVAFDLADDFPEAMFSDLGGERIYIGPAFRDCLHPATWATDQIPQAKGRPISVLRDSFRDLWAYVPETDMFVCTEMPSLIYSEEILNKVLAPFSHVASTSKLIVKGQRGTTTNICYRPDVKGLIVSDGSDRAINLHIPSTIEPLPGDVGPFLEFMEYLFVNENERREALRWCATLIARPEIRMGYGMLLISEKQGTGKTTLGAAILAPLVGMQNVGFPSETDVNSQFNSWVAKKRLAIVSEIYSGSSWKAYNTLKAVITDKDITVNEKYQRTHRIENWCHVLASSNSMRALKMENDDRRWFYPEVTEVPWNREKFGHLREWLGRGGLNFIAHWAVTFGDYVKPGETAPMTERKREMIEGSRSAGQQAAIDIGSQVADMEVPIAIDLKDCVRIIKGRSEEKVFDSDYEIRRALTEAGMTLYSKRIKVRSVMRYILMNPKMVDVVNGIELETEKAKALRDNLKLTAEITEGEM